MPEPELKRQASRCMGCGVPFCNDACPLGNLIPDWNDLVRTGKWREAIDQLHATNNFPEFTGLICPAPCESACVLAINDDSVTIKQIEYAIVERAWNEGWITPNVPEKRTGQAVAVIGSGPAGLAAAAELNQVGHEVTVFERDEAPGGLMRFGVPDAKLEKWMIDRRVDVLAAEGIHFEYGADIGGSGMCVDEPSRPLQRRRRRDGLARPARRSRCRDRDLDGVHDAMDYLYIRNRYVASISGGPDGPEPAVDDRRQGQGRRRDRRRRHRHGLHLEREPRGRSLDAPPGRLPRGAEGRPLPDTPWPLPLKRSVHDLRARRGRRAALRPPGDRASRRCRRQRRRAGRPQVTGSSSRTLETVEGSEYTLPAQLVLIAVGFTGPEREGLLDGLGRRSRQPRQRPRPGLRLDRERNLRRRRRPSRPVADRHRNRRGPPLRPSSRPLPKRRGPGHSRGPPDRPLRSVELALPRASLVENVRLNATGVVPNAVQGIFRRRRQMVRVAHIAHTDGLLVGSLEGMNRKYGGLPVWVKVMRDDALLMFDPADIARSLTESPEPLAADPEAKRKGMAHFQPDALTISRGDDWRSRRRFAESILGRAPVDRRPCRRCARRPRRSSTTAVARSATSPGTRCSNASPRRVVLGDARGGRHGPHRDARATCRRAPTRCPTSRTRTWRRSRPGSPSTSRAPRRAASRRSPPSAPQDERTEAARAAHALALRHGRHDRREHDALPGRARLAIPSSASSRRPTEAYLDACLHETMRLWPTTNMLSRVSLEPTEWHGETVPAGTQFLVLNHYAHRDRDRVPLRRPLRARGVDRGRRRRLRGLQPLQPRASGLPGRGDRAPPGPHGHGAPCSNGASPQRAPRSTHRSRCRT